MIELFSWDKQAASLYKEAQGYMKVLEGHLVKPSRFDNALLFNISVMSLEKLLASLLSYYETEPEHHTPGAMFREASKYDNGLTENMRNTAIFMQKFEAICSFDVKAYKTPENEELLKIIHGLIEIRNHVIDVLKETI